MTRVSLAADRLIALPEGRLQRLDFVTEANNLGAKRIASAARGRTCAGVNSPSPARISFNSIAAPIALGAKFDPLGPHPVELVAQSADLALDLELPC